MIMDRKSRVLKLIYFQKELLKLIKVKVMMNAIGVGYCFLALELPKKGT